MIKGFEELTKELSEKEFKIVLPEVVTLLKNAVGKKKAMTNSFLIMSLKKNNIKTSQARIRKIIHYIRITGIIECLIATQKGYYISNDPLELTNYVDSLLQRISSIEQIANQLGYQKDKNFNTGQKKMFFNG